MTNTSAVSGNSMIDDVAGRAHQAVDRATEKAAPAIDKASTVAHRSIDKAATAAVSAAEWVAQSTEQIANRSSDLAGVCSGYIRERPLLSVVGALALGYFAGKLLR